MEWPELLGLYREMLHQYALWVDNDCEGEPPMLLDSSRVRGPVPPDLAVYAAELAARTAAMSYRSRSSGQTSRLTWLTGVGVPCKNRPFVDSAQGGDFHG